MCDRGKKQCGLRVSCIPNTSHGLRIRMGNGGAVLGSLRASSSGNVTVVALPMRLGTKGGMVHVYDPCY